jgi:hypothetical protein
MRLKNICFTIYLLLSVVAINAQQPHYMKGFVDRNYLLNLKVMEVSDTASRFSVSTGHLFGYCGDIEGAVVNLLQTTFGSTPHVRFLNKPKQKQYVYFHSNGFHMGDAAIGTPTQNSLRDFFYKGLSQAAPDTTESRYLNLHGRDIVMEVLKREFNFDVKMVSDSLDVVELKVIDATKLSLFKIPYKEVDKWENGCERFSFVYKYMPKPKFCIKTILTIFTINLENIWNIYVVDKTNTRPQGYFLEFPTELFKSYEMLPQLDHYLREQYGLTLVKKKEYRTVFNIQFND